LPRGGIPQEEGLPDRWRLLCREIGPFGGKSKRKVQAGWSLGGYSLSLYFIRGRRDGVRRCRPHQGRTGHGLTIQA